MKIKFGFIIMMMAAVFTVSSCSDDDEPTTGGGGAVTEDGWYVSGAATSTGALDFVTLLTSTPNEVGGVERPGLVAKFMTLEAGKEFKIVSVAGTSQKTYGAADSISTVNPDYKDDQVRSNVTWGAIKEGGAAITVPETGLYLVCFDETTMFFSAAIINHWGAIGGATKGGWGSEQKMELVGTYNTDALSYAATDVQMTKDGEYKFRASNGWKVNVGDPMVPSEVRVNANFGGDVANLVIGAANIKCTETGLYTLTLSWNKGNGKWSATAVKTGEYVAPTYPDSMWVAGEAVSTGWSTVDPVGAMHAVANGTAGDGLYWKICYIEAGKGFKIAGKNWGNPDCKFAETTFDADGIAVTDGGGGNWNIATSGLYTIALDIREGVKKVSIRDVKVYGMGDAFGGWTAQVAANLFTVDNTAKTVISPALPAGGTLRTYVSHPWISGATDGNWWTSEFVVNGTSIEYRNDSNNDPTAITVTAGQIVTYHFDDNTGSIQ